MKGIKKVFLPMPDMTLTKFKAMTTTAIVQQLQSAPINLTSSGKKIAIVTAPSVVVNPTPTPVPTPVPVPGQPILMGCKAIQDVQMPNVVKVICTATATDQDYNNVLFDIEINQGGVKVAQSFKANINLAKGQAYTYEFDFQPSSAGAFTVSAGIFDSPAAGSYNWGTKRTFTDNIAPFNVTAAAPYVSPSSSTGLWVAPQSVDQYVATHPEFKQLADTPTGVWLTDTKSVTSDSIASMMKAANGATPTFIVYNIPGRDNGNYSAGGDDNLPDYESWVGGVVKGIGSGKAIIILEPDALGLLSGLSQQNQSDRLAELKNAIQQFKANLGTKVYVDASSWVDPNTMAGLLKQINPGNLDGFSLNVSGYNKTSDMVAYGNQISVQTGLHYVIDTSRNGNGGTNNGQWCNPTGQKIGVKPQFNPDSTNKYLDAYLWLKVPGESDGNCNGGPNAGVFWPDAAEQLIK